MKTKIKTRWMPHSTVAAVIEREGLFLLVEEDTSDGLKLNNPAGHLDQGESLVEACVRETREETGWGFTPTALLGVYCHRFRSSKGKDETYMRFSFKGILGKHFKDEPLDEGIVRTVWMSYEEIKSCPERHRSPLMLQSINAYRSGISFSLSVLTTNATVYSDPVHLESLTPIC